MGMIVLGSGSPRRLEILRGLGYAVEVKTAPIDEREGAAEVAESYVLRMALEKNRAVRALDRDFGHGRRVLLTADTTVALDDRILGKPTDADEAAAMLEALSGGTHEVLTAVCVFDGIQEHHAIQISRVTFAPLSDAAIAAYIATGEPMDKAGAYGIQGLGGALVAHLDGSHSGVMGLPVYETVQLLSRAGIELWRA